MVYKDCFLGVTRQKRRKAQEPAKKTTTTAGKGKRKRRPAQDQDSMEVDEMSQNSTMRDLSLSEPEQSHIHQLTLDAVKVT